MSSLKTARYLAMAGLLLSTSRLTSAQALTPSPISVSFGNQACWRRFRSEFFPSRTRSLELRLIKLRMAQQSRRLRRIR